jgi:tetratricopeptide (TPR) repeat protein
MFDQSETAQSALEAFRSSPDPAFPVPASVPAWETLRSGQVEEAKAAFMEALQANPRDSYAFAGLALTCQELGVPEDANLNIEKALFLAPSSPMIRHAAVRIALNQGRKDDALEAYHQVHELIENKEFSSSYYYRTYYRFFLISDLVPQLLRGELAPEMIESFYMLSEHYVVIDNQEKGSIIDRRIELELREDF